MKRPENLGRAKLRAVLAGLAFFSSSFLMSGGGENYGLETKEASFSHSSRIGSLIINNYYPSSYQKKSIEEFINRSIKLKETIHHFESRSIYLARLAQSLVTPLEYAEWSKVNICEEGGRWDISGSKFSGGLGIANVNWVNYGGTEFTPSASTATPDEQIVVAMRIQSDPPDQDGCAAW